MQLRVLFVLFLGLLAVQPALAHRFAPSLLKVTEMAPNAFNMVWKTPAQGTSNVPLRPTWPEACEVTQASPPQLEGTGKVSSFQLSCPGLGDSGLVGATLGVDGLGANQASAMVMIDLLDGRSYQQVLNAEQTEFVVPAESSAGDVMSDYMTLGIEHIWIGIDHILFLLVLLLPAVVQRKDGKWAWHIKAANGRIVATDGHQQFYVVFYEEVFPELFIFRFMTAHLQCRSTLSADMIRKTEIDLFEYRLLGKQAFISTVQSKHTVTAF